MLENGRLRGELRELHRLCKEGKLYEVEDWIRQGRPLQGGPPARPHWRYRTALEIALETGQHSLTLLLLRNGYILDVEKGAQLLAHLLTVFYGDISLRVIDIDTYPPSPLVRPHLEVEDLEILGLGSPTAQLPEVGGHRILNRPFTGSRLQNR